MSYLRVGHEADDNNRIAWLTLNQEAGRLRVAAGGNLLELHFNLGSRGQRGPTEIRFVVYAIDGFVSCGVYCGQRAGRKQYVSRGNSYRPGR